MNIRPMGDSDLNFVLSTWLKSYYEALKFYASGSVRVPYPKDDVFFQGHQAKIKALLLNPNTHCLVCVAPDDNDQIIGWLVYDRSTLHYCYVKHVFRNLGAGKKLKAAMTAPVALYSHHTKFSKHLNQGLTYDPYKF